MTLASSTSITTAVPALGKGLEFWRRRWRQAVPLGGRRSPPAPQVPCPGEGTHSGEPAHTPRRPRSSVPPSHFHLPPVPGKRAWPPPATATGAGQGGEQRPFAPQTGGCSRLLQLGGSLRTLPPPSPRTLTGAALSSLAMKHRYGPSKVWRRRQRRTPHAGRAGRGGAAPPAGEGLGRGGGAAAPQPQLQAGGTRLHPLGSGSGEGGDGFRDVPAASHLGGDSCSSVAWKKGVWRKGGVVAGPSSCTCLTPEPVSSFSRSSKCFLEQ